MTLIDYLFLSQYFLNPKVRNESVPVQLEIISQEILVPLQATFHDFVNKVVLLLFISNFLLIHLALLMLICILFLLQTLSFQDPFQDQVQSKLEEIILIICKCMYFSVSFY